MKLSQIILLTAIGMSGAYAASAPVTDSSIYKTANANNAKLTTRLNKLQVVVANLQVKVDKLHARKYTKAALKRTAVKTTTTQKTKAVIGTSKGVKKTYRVAYLSLRAKKTDVAIKGFNNIIKNYPQSSLADNSQYWLGEAYLLKGQKEKAMQEFDKVVANYPTSDKVPGALLKLGLVQLSLKNRPKAKEYLDYIINNYPKTRAAKIAIKKTGQAKL
jgi:tol-pal system protein YbgF